MGQPCVSCSLWSASYRLGEKFDQMSDQSRGVGGLSAVDRPRFSFVSFNTKRSVDSSLLALGEREIYHFDFSEGQAVVSSPKVDYQRWLVSILRVSTALVWNTGHVTHWTRLLPGPGTKGGGPPETSPRPAGATDRLYKQSCECGIFVRNWRKRVGARFFVRRRQTRKRRDQHQQRRWGRSLQFFGLYFSSFHGPAQVLFCVILLASTLFHVTKANGWLTQRKMAN